MLGAACCLLHGSRHRARAFGCEAKSTRVLHREVRGKGEGSHVYGYMSRQEKVDQETTSTQDHTRAGERYFLTQEHQLFLSLLLKTG